MIEVDKLYGTCHGGKLFGLVFNVDLFFKPSPVMLEELAELPRGTRVGIESVTPEEKEALNKLVIDGRGVMWDKPFGEYWKAIVDHCKKAGHEVVYLDSVELCRKHAEMDVKATHLAEEAKQTKDKAERLILIRQEYAHRVENRYIREVEREQSLLQRIRETKPSVALLGRSHTDYIWQMGVEGIQFKSYSAEVAPVIDQFQLGKFDPSDKYFNMDLESVARSISNQIPPLELVNNRVVDSKVVARRIESERKYRAIKEGRITDGDPDFVGTWNIRIPAQGLFELYIQKRDGRRISGIIEDACGSATFEGESTDTEIWFVKRYDDDAISIGGWSIFFYAEERQNGTVKGTYYSEDHPGKQEFEMTEQR